MTAFFGRSALPFGTLRVEAGANGRQAFGHGGVRGLAAFHFPRDVAGIAGVAQDFGDPLVVEVEGVKLAAAIVGLRLDED
jgi:hypothetical protein